MYGFCGVWCEVDVVDVFVLLCVVLVLFLVVPAYSVCEVDGSVGYCGDYEAVLFGCVAVDCP